MKYLNWKTILIVGSIIRLSYYLLIPPGQLPDEIFIYKRIWTNISKPGNELFPAGDYLHYFNNEYYYPPLYYELSSVLLRVAHNTTQKPLDINSSFNFSSKILRLTSFFMSVYGLFLIWKILNFLNISYVVKLSSFIFASLLPSLSSFSISANQNNLAFFLSILFVYLSIATYKSNPNNIKVFAMGAVFGLAIFTKFDAIYLLPFVFLPLVKLIKYKHQLVNSMSIFLASSILFGGWWYFANIIKFGWFYDKDMFLSAASECIMPFSFQQYYLHVFLNTFYTFFAVQGINNNLYLNPNLYILFLIITIVFFIKTIIVFIGSIHSYRKRNPSGFLIFKYFLVILLSNFCMFLYLNSTTYYAPQGRYFFMSIITIALMWVYGLIQLVPKKSRGVVPIWLLIFFIILNIFSLNCGLYFFNRFNFLPNSFMCKGSQVLINKIHPD